MRERKVYAHGRLQKLVGDMEVGFETMMRSWCVVPISQRNKRAHDASVSTYKGAFNYPSRKNICQVLMKLDSKKWGSMALVIIGVSNFHFLGPKKY